MSRVRQQHPGNYRTSGNISAEFENLYRYLSSAEYGGKTLSELLAGFVNKDDGSFAGPVQLRFTADDGLQFRIGTFASDDIGWSNIAPASALKGADGEAVGDITQSPIGTAFQVVSTAGQTVFDFAFNPADNVLVFRSGILMREGAIRDFTRSATGGTGGGSAIIFNSPQTAGQNYQFIRIAASTAVSFIRQDTDTLAAQAVFPYNVALTNENITVYLNGLLQREGSTADYTRQAGGNTITFNSAVPAGNVVTITGFSAPTNISVPGLMQAKSFVDPATGLIRYDRLGIAAGQIPNDRVNGLPALMNNAAQLHIGPTAPANPAAQRLWIDTSATPSVLKAWDGSTWIATSVASIVPLFGPTDAGRVLKVNGTGTAANWDNVDLSSVIPRTFMGAANGVPQLDANGRIPSTQMPSAIPYSTIYEFKDGAITGGNYPLTRLFGQRIRIIGFRGSLTGGTATAQLTVSGVGVGGTYTLSTSPTEASLGTPIEVDALLASRAIGVSITSPASATGLEIALACQLVL